MGERDELAAHAFISYVRENSRAVEQLQRTLEAAGIKVWRDKADLWPGEDWRAKIRNAITNDALVFIVCFSHESHARKASYQNEELALAIDEMRKRPPDEPWLIPVRLDDCEIPDRDIGGGRTLNSIQWADLFGSGAKDGAERLVATVLKILGRYSAIPRTNGSAARPTSDAATSPAQHSESVSPSASRWRGTAPTEAEQAESSGPTSGYLYHDDLLAELARLQSELAGALGRIDDDAQELDFSLEIIHQHVEGTWRFVRQRIFGPNSPLDSTAHADMYRELESARAEENDMHEIYADDLNRYHEGRQKKDRGFVKKRRAYISALHVFEAHLSAILHNPGGLLP